MELPKKLIAFVGQKLGKKKMNCSFVDVGKKTTAKYCDFFQFSLVLPKKREPILIIIRINLQYFLSRIGNRWVDVFFVLWEDHDYARRWKALDPVSLLLVGLFFF